MRLRSLALLGAGGWALYRLTQQLGRPAGVEPVRPFSLTRYLGRWYEIARIDHSYEHGLTNTSADYRPLPGGRVQVVNRGYHPASGRWREARATASPVTGAAGAAQHALVSGPTHDYLWLLSRTPQIRPSVRATLLEQARAAGFDTGRLLWVDQRRNTAGLRGDLPRRKLPR